MKSSRTLLITAATAALTAFAIADHHLEGEKKAKPAEFLSETIDIGCVVSDIGASVKFYTEALGFTEVQGFKVPADFAEESGLTDKKMLDVHVLKLGTGPGSTKLKLMQIEGAGNAKADHAFIDTTLGFSYITIVVKSTDDALVRMRAAGVKPIADGPVVLPDSLDPKLSLTIVRDPDGNLVELVGPKPTK